MLTADGILNSSDLSDLKKVNVPEWGGEVYIRVMTGIERDRWEIAATSAMKDTQTLNIRATLCAICICDDKGKRLFTDEQAQALGEKSSLALGRVFEVARHLNRLTDRDLEELEGN